MTDMLHGLDETEKRQLQERLMELFTEYGLSVGVGLTQKGIAIRSQDERVDAVSIGTVKPFEPRPSTTDETTVMKAVKLKTLEVSDKEVEILIEAMGRYMDIVGSDEELRNLQDILIKARDAE